MAVNILKQFLDCKSIKPKKIAQVTTGTVASIVTAWVSVTPAHAASFVPIGDLPGGDFLSEALGVSADGSVVVGISNSAKGYEAFRWEDGVLTGLGDLPDGSAEENFFSVATGVSADGSIVVGNSVSEYGDEAFRWESGVLVGLGRRTEGINYYSYATGVSADGSVIIGTTGDGDEYQEAVRWEDGVFTGLGYLPGGDNFSEANGVSADGSVIVGASPTADRFEAFRWENELLTGLSGLPRGQFTSRANGVSADGSVVVGEAFSDNDPEAFRWENGVFVGLGTLPRGQFGSTANGVSADGSVVVGSSSNGDPTNAGEAFVWNSTNGMLSVKSILTAAGIDLTGWLLTDANAVSADGRTIVGRGLNPSGNEEGWIARLDASTPLPTPVPEPGSPTALLTGLVGIGIAAYQKRKNKTA